MNQPAALEKLEGNAATLIGRALDSFIAGWVRVVKSRVAQTDQAPSPGRSQSLP